MAAKSSKKIIYRCQDGYYGNAKSVCRPHGGTARVRVIIPTPRYLNTLVSRVRRAATAMILPLVEEKPTQTPIFEGGGVLNVPLSHINLAHNLFQNRGEKFSKRSVENIIAAVEDGSFKWANLDPITLWKNPEDEKLYVLSGHSRLEAFRRLQNKGAIVDNRNFESIPSKIIDDIDLAAARQIAYDSNTLSTKETELERASYYRKMRADGAQKKEIDTQAAKNEGDNSRRILAFSYLNPQGKAIYTINSLQGAQEQSQNNAKTIAKWLGEVRRRFPTLTDFNENELYDYLTSSDSPKQPKTEVDLIKFVTDALGKRTGESLNLKSSVYKSPVELQYDEQVKTAAENLKLSQQALKEKEAQLLKRGGTTDQVMKITEQLRVTVLRHRAEYERLLGKKQEVLDYLKNQGDLFGDGLRGLRGQKQQHGFYI
jgi:hypothetical protein